MIRLSPVGRAAIQRTKFPLKI